jgi:hypothetical protein
MFTVDEGWVVLSARFAVVLLPGLAECGAGQTSGDRWTSHKLTQDTGQASEDLFRQLVRHPPVGKGCRGPFKISNEALTSTTEEAREGKGVSCIFVSSGAQYKSQKAFEGVS